jgi:hypothetical protein
VRNREAQTVRSLALVALLAFFGSAGACASGASPPSLRSDAGGVPDDDGPGEAAASGGFDGSFGGDTASPGMGCSADLQSVVDGQGHIVQQCPPDQGCAGGVCIAACDAAAANHGNVGCDFLVSTPSFYEADQPPCFAVFLANNWPHDAKVTVTRGGQSFDVTQFGRVPDGTADATGWAAVPASGIASAKVAVLFMSQDPTSKNGPFPLNCPVPAAVNGPNGTAVYSGFDSTGRGTAWHIVTDVPVSAYDMVPYGGAKSFLPSAELLFPTTAWGKNYVAVLPRPTTGPPWAQIVGSVDGTTVSIVPTAPLPAGPGVIGAPANQVTQYSLNAGEYVQWQASGADGEMTGSIILADHPIAFVGGTAFLCLHSQTSTGGGCDSAHQMIPPVAALGSEYVAPPYATRLASLEPESIPYRLVGAQDGTTLTYDPPVAGAPSTLAQGQLAEFETTVAFSVKSQDSKHPFYVGQHMTGSILVGPSRPATTGDVCPGYLGDEEFVNLVPPAQWLSKYVFFTDPTYTTTNLVLVRKKTSGGFQSVMVDCVGDVTGWQPVDSAGNYEVTNVDLVRGQPNGSCTNGGHVASSSGPFGLVVWGLDACSSYAYPAGGNVVEINDVVIPPVPR